MKLTGNIALVLAVFFLAYPALPNFPALRAAILRLNGGPIGPVYALLFWLTPKFLRQILASLALWGMVMVALVAAIQAGGLEWIGVGWLLQVVVAAAGCFALAEISVLIGLTYGDRDFPLPDVVRAISPWGAWVLPILVMSFALCAINPAIAASVPTWLYRAPLMAAWAIGLPIGAILFVRWISPECPVSTPAA